MAEPAGELAPAPRVPEAVRDLFSPELATRLVALRQDLHRRPELAFEEHQTADRLQAELESLSVEEVHRAAGTGVLGRVRGRRRGTPVVAIRGDIDALPIQEDTGLPYASVHPGRMHACGHDVHASWAVGAAALLRAEPAEGDVLIVLQPAEEATDGAKALMDAGALADVAAIFGAHVDRRFAVGQVVAQEGSVNAASDVFDIEILGRGAHGARPHEAADPIVAAAAIVSALQTLVSRRLDPGTPGVVSVGSIHAGVAPNVIPETAHLTGTIRSFDPSSRELLKSELVRLAEGTAAAHDVRAGVTFSDASPPVINLPRPTAWAREAVTRLLGSEALTPLGFVNMGGEDFAFYLESIEGCFLRIGAREAGGEVIAAHSPRFVAAEESIFLGAAVLAAVARHASAVLAGGSRE